MSTKRTAEAIWIESKKYWQIKVQRNGVRKAFTSSTKGRKGKHEAEAKADEWLESGTEDVRFDVAVKMYLDDIQRRTSLCNYKDHEWIMRSYVIPEIKARKLSTITNAMWQRCILRAADAGLSRQTCSNVRTAIVSFVHFAESNRWKIEKQDAKKLTIPNSAAPRKKKIILQPTEIRLLFEKDTVIQRKKPVFARDIYAWRFFVVTGLRRGELCGLKKDDLVGNVLSIKRSINSYGQETSAKNDNARREIVLSDVAMRVLKDQKEMLMREGIIASEWIFPDKYGERISPKHVYATWKQYARQNDIQSSLHDLRHTFISVNKADLPLELMKAVVGHSKAMDTYGIYGHEVEGEKERAASIVDGVFTKIIGNVGGNVGGKE
jgi:integrase